MKVREEITQDQSQLDQMSLAIDELVKYLNDLAEMNQTENLHIKMTIEG